MEENKNNKVSKKEVINLLKCDDSNFPKCIFKDKKKFQNNDDSTNWWKETINNEIYYNQKAHVIMHYLMTGSFRFVNKGAKDWYKNYKNEETKLVLSENEIINMILDYLHLYFKSKRAFDEKGDYKNNVDILKNIENFFLNDLTKKTLDNSYETKKIQMQEYCNKINLIINDMQKLLKDNPNSSTYKENLNNTIIKTTEILNKLNN